MFKLCATFLSCNQKWANFFVNRLLNYFMYPHCFGILIGLFICVFQLSAKPIVLKSYQVAKTRFTGYLPVDQQVFWTRTRPKCQADQSLIVPAAFTHLDMSIVGAAIEWGKVINQRISADLSGFCLIRDKKPWVVNQAQMKVGGLRKWAQLGTSVFQQDLLVLNGKKVPISHAAALNWWRALVIFSDRFEVVENVNRIRRDAFQSALIKIGVQQAIYLDMGTWSEGAYYSSAKRVVKIGKMRKNTSKQTNWLVFH